MARLLFWLAENRMQAYKNHRASSREYLEFILDRLSGVEGVSHRAMMGEYILYCHGKIMGGIYDDRLLVKPTAAAQRLMPHAPVEKPYEGAKDMLLVEEVDRPGFLVELVRAICEELAAPKSKRTSKQGPTPRDRTSGGGAALSGPCLQDSTGTQWGRTWDGWRDWKSHPPGGRDEARPSRNGHVPGARQEHMNRAKAPRRRGA